MLSIFFLFEILLIFIFKILSPAEMFLGLMNYAHTHLDFRRRRWVKDFAPLKDSVTIITPTRFFIHSYHITHAGFDFCGRRAVLRHLAVSLYF